MNDIIVKNVDFHGDELLAIKHSNEKIYVAISCICNGIGLTEGQFRRQKQNLHEDIVLQKGITNLSYPTSGGIERSEMFA